MTVVVGTNNLTRGGIEHKSKRLIVHPNYNRTALTGDIGLIELDSPLNFSSTVRPISLPSRNIILPLTPVVATGWGTKSVSILPIIYIYIIRKKKLFMKNVNKMFETNINYLNNLGKIR